MGGLSELGGQSELEGHSEVGDWSDLVGGHSIVRGYSDFRVIQIQRGHSRFIGVIQVCRFCCGVEMSVSLRYQNNTL